jgi:hypothetical protein
MPGSGKRARTFIEISAHRERDMETNYISGAMETRDVLDVCQFDVVYIWQNS